VAETLSIKVPRLTKTRLRAAALSRRTTASALLREALELVVAGQSSGQASLYELSRDLFEDLGRGGPRDLSTNPRYLSDLGK
jgi:predicted transcriptional regulator